MASGWSWTASAGSEGHRDDVLSPKGVDTSDTRGRLWTCHATAEAAAAVVWGQPISPQATCTLFNGDRFSLSPNSDDGPQSVLKIRGGHPDARIEHHRYIQRFPSD